MCPRSKATLATPERVFLAKPPVEAMEFGATPTPLAMVFMATALTGQVSLGTAQHSLAFMATVQVIRGYLVKVSQALGCLEKGASLLDALKVT
jgi:hypothetical protein